MTIESASALVQSSYVDALRTDTALLAFIASSRAMLNLSSSDQAKKFVHDGMASEGSPSEYIVISSGLETRGALASFGDAASSGTDTLHLWSQLSQLAIRQMYAHVRRVLEAQAFTLTGGNTFITGDAVLAGTFRDSVSQAYRGVVQFRWNVVAT